MKSTPGQGSNDHTVKTTKVISCTCKHEYQDKKYGAGNRVMNPYKGGYRCTVCGRSHAK